MSIDVLCIGHAAYDLGVFVEQYPAEDSKCETRDLLEACGGPAANAAHLLSLWGDHCAFAGMIGNDHYGQCIQREFQAVGTDISLLEMRDNHPTPVSLILINRQNGSRTIVTRKAHGVAFRPKTTALAAIAPKVLLFDGHEFEASNTALQTYTKAVSILDAGSWRDGTAKLAAQVDYLVASEQFGKQATTITDLREVAAQQACLRQLRERFQTTVVVTLGEEGLIADDGTGFRHLPAYRAEVVDTTGAGDIFHGAFAHGINHSMELWQSLRFASMAASLSVEVAGGRSSIPTLARVTEALAHVG